MSLFKRGGVYWSYVWEDGVRHARSTNTGNKRTAETIDQKHKEEIRLKATLCPELAPNMKFAELAAKFLGAGTAKAWHKERLTVLLPYFADCPIGKINKKSPGTNSSAAQATPNTRGYPANGPSASLGSCR